MRDLIEEAKAARLRAHAPYSNFLVGAALMVGAFIGLVQGFVSV